jgi:hypothetical protein
MLFIEANNAGRRIQIDTGVSELPLATFEDWICWRQYVQIEAASPYRWRQYHELLLTYTASPSWYFSRETPCTYLSKHLPGSRGHFQELQEHLPGHAAGEEDDKSGKMRIREVSKRPGGFCLAASSVGEGGTGIVAVTRFVDWEKVLGQRGQ